MESNMTKGQNHKLGEKSAIHSRKGVANGPTCPELADWLYFLDRPKGKWRLAMGYYFDWLNEKWVEKPAVQPRRPHRMFPRRTLVTALVEEMLKGDSEAKLYAAMLARKLIVGDRELMAEFGKQIAAMTERSCART